ncbi:MAG: hypothetical protein R2728_10680 [Chitinophagales bacterium]
MSFGSVMPEIAFDSDKSIYLGKQGNKNVSIKIVNTPKLLFPFTRFLKTTCSISFKEAKIGALIMIMTAIPEIINTMTTAYYEISDVGQLVYEQEMETENLPSLGISKLLHIDFEDKLKDKEGVYVVKVQDNEKYYISDSKDNFPF